MAGRLFEITMSQPPEDFSEICRVLAWKRHESPPPGYFNGFSNKIIARIEAEQLASKAPWWHLLLRSLNWQRGLMGANVLIAAGAGIVGIAGYHTLRSVPDDEGVAWAPLPLPVPGESPAGGIFADNNSVFHASGAPEGPVSLAGFSGFGIGAGNANGAGGTNDHTAPAGLFSPPGMGQLHPRFVLPPR
jgi:hypothetical protein